MSINKLIVVARKTRKWAMRVRKKYGFPTSLAGMCAICSYKLAEQLPNCMIHVANNHVWVTYNGFAIDVTGTQFKLKPVIVLPIDKYKEITSVYITKDVRIYHDLTSFINGLIKLHWPNDQLPIQYNQISTYSSPGR